ncbi:long-subunit fatty acid transport protein [Flavobacteriaceae bacterium MAR_2010_72]|nr:long-subunit fatty acid transport protein [Flavobacteriaceae bacterium MAR_2010_72]TVZ57841.1 long-subunit fatty acid transport protein [Flavobacteriaceae bacterium MAR_2010_105]
MIKKLVIVLTVFFAYQMNAQEGTSSPYSFYGIGTLKFKGTVENKSMGGLSIFTDSIHVNLRNPASYAGPNLKSFNDENRPIKFAVAGSHSSLNLKANSGSDKTSSTTFDYLALSFPLGKFGIGFGLLPYTSVGYKLESRESDVLANRYRGEGGLNKTYLGLGYQISNSLSFGVDVSYNFGNVQNTVIEFVYDSEGNPAQYHSREDNRSDLSGLNVNFGLSYKTMVSEKLELVTGLTYTPKSTLTSNNERSFATIAFNSSGQEFVINEIEVDLGSNNLKTTDLTLPSRFSIGAGLGQPRKWFIGTEYTSLKTSEFKNPIFSIDNTTFVDGSTFALGGFWIPDYNSFGSYWKRATYRAGLHFENTGLEINDETINEFGISFGVGLPVGNFFSNANIGFEIGKRGTTNKNLIQENFFNINIGLSLNDRWFEKRKYN